jgi:hypothetical protein
MKKAIVLFIMLFGIGNAYAQDGVADKIAKQAVEIDSLKKVVKIFIFKNDSLKNVILNYQVSEKKDLDAINELKKELSKLEKYKLEKKAIETKLAVKNDSIVLLKNKIILIENEIKSTIEKGKKNAAAEKENGKNEILDKLLNTYKNKSLDELIKSSSLTALLRDKQLIGNNTDVKQIIFELETYFNAEKLLSNKFNASQVNNALSQLPLIKQQSKLVPTLKDNLDNFKAFNDGLNTAIQNIIEIDKIELVKGMPKEVINSKLHKVLSELSKYIFDYNFNSVDYPYLSDVVLEIIKRKQPNPDADISELLKKIE